MTESLIFLGVLIATFIGAICWLDCMLPTAEDEEKQAQADMQDLLKRANRETQERRRVMAGTNERA